MKTKKKLYSMRVKEKAEKKIPAEILIAMHQTGWNVFGIYEAVEKALSEEKRLVKKETHENETNNQE